MEVSIGDYGRMIFEMTVGEKYADPPEHWASIMAEAEPLVRQLIALNQKMTVDGKPGGYKIHGYTEKVKGKKRKVLSDHEKIRAAQRQLLVAAGTLQEGDMFWLFDNDDHEMYVEQDDPLTVEEVTKKGVYFEMSHLGGHHTERIDLKEKVLKAPDFFKEHRAICDRFHLNEIDADTMTKLREAVYEQEKEFTSDAYWLTQYEAMQK